MALTRFVTLTVLIFIASCAPHGAGQTGAGREETFDRFDANGDHLISKVEWGLVVDKSASLLRNKSDSENFKNSSFSVFNQLDKNADGRIDQNEWDAGTRNGITMDYGNNQR